ncbi:hypothetical protein GCM10018954_010240 [Kutzneria kofuensis]
MIDPRRLRVLRALADHGTVTAAGRALHLTASAVSQQLAALEAETGQQLLRRKGRRVWLTPAGELLVVHANAVAAELERAEATLASFAAGVRGPVRLASFASAITQVVAPAVAELRANAPDVTLLVQDAEGHASVPLLLDGEIDVAITEEYRPAPQTDDRRLKRFPLYAEPFDVVLPEDHRLADESEVDVSALGGEDWIAPLPGNPCRDVLLLACSTHGSATRPTTSAPSSRWSPPARAWLWCRATPSRGHPARLPSPSRGTSRCAGCSPPFAREARTTR